MVLILPWGAFFAKSGYWGWIYFMDLFCGFTDCGTIYATSKNHATILENDRIAGGDILFFISCS
jgi:hypothetical protein